MSSQKRLLATAAVVLTSALTAALTGCSSSGGSGGDPLKGDGGGNGTVVVGSNNFAESTLLSDIYGEALKAKGLKVEYKHNIGSRETTYGLIKNGTLTVLPEYNGALLAYLDKDAVPKTVEETGKAVTDKLAPKLGLLEPSRAQDKDAVTVNAATAGKYHLTSDSTIADLADAAPGLVIGGSPEFQTRHQGLDGLKSVYGVTFRSFKALDAGGPLTIAALKGGNIQVGDVFTTDPSIRKNRFVVLRDPKNLFGFENVVPLVYRPDLPKAGAAALNAVSAALDTPTLLKLGTEVQNEQKDPMDVARSWLKAEHLI
ncbi:glycine/betaine ABC transporter substrate-binding protein [Streptomyces sulfonofaciens]|uniref:Glycine/betaine ABC transporter substrate-binding protein n=1 Tax=Streptomyces sulfonofaciens TaxID=68272 RepID=A0A919FR90_9ACTN|nr:ABC transporter substrate-binding protein [Streptomyces sulfonofaciens]GHH70997.1 glycine/betaine ABC transporter substrate-binding protein [Streptomyces sulfonofaciens]